MITTINNELRVLQIITNSGKQYFCNPKDYNNVINENELISGGFMVYHFWNNKPKKISKIDLLNLLTN